MSFCMLMILVRLRTVLSSRCGNLFERRTRQQPARPIIRLVAVVLVSAMSIRSVTAQCPLSTSEQFFDYACKSPIVEDIERLGSWHREQYTVTRHLDGYSYDVVYLRTRSSVLQYTLHPDGRRMVSVNIDLQQAPRSLACLASMARGDLRRLLGARPVTNNESETAAVAPLKVAPDNFDRINTVDDVPTASLEYDSFSKLRRIRILCLEYSPV